MNQKKFDLQLFNAFGGPPAGPAAGPAPSPATELPMSPPPAGPTQAPQQPVQQPAQTNPQQQDPGNRPEGHVIRSVLDNAQRQWMQQNQSALELAQVLQQMGRDPAQLLQQLRERMQQEQFQQQTGMDPNQIDPRFVQHMTGLEQQLNNLQTQFQRQEGMRMLQEAEAKTTQMAQQFGMDYAGADPTNPSRTVRDAVREFALKNEVPIDIAFQSLYFNHIMTVRSQQAQGQAIAQMQGRGQGVQPPSSAVPSNVQQPGASNWLTMPRAQFQQERARLRGGY